MCNNLMLQQHFFVVVAPPHPPTIQMSIGSIYFHDILMSRFVKSQKPRKTTL